MASLPRSQATASAPGRPPQNTWERRGDGRLVYSAFLKESITPFPHCGTESPSGSNLGQHCQGDRHCTRRRGCGTGEKLQEGGSPARWEHSRGDDRGSRGPGAEEEQVRRQEVPPQQRAARAGDTTGESASEPNALGNKGRGPRTEPHMRAGLSIAENTITGERRAQEGGPRKKGRAFLRLSAKRQHSAPRAPPHTEMSVELPRFCWETDPPPLAQWLGGEGSFHKN